MATQLFIYDKPARIAASSANEAYDHIKEPVMPLALESCAGLTKPGASGFQQQIASICSIYCLERYMIDIETPV